MLLANKCCMTKALHTLIAVVAYTFTDVVADAPMLLQSLIAFSAEQCYGAGAKSLMSVCLGACYCLSQAVASDACICPFGASDTDGPQQIPQDRHEAYSYSSVSDWQ